MRKDYDEYSSLSFTNTVIHFLNSGFIQSTIGQLEDGDLTSKVTTSLIVQSESEQIVPMPSGQMPKILETLNLNFRECGDTQQTAGCDDMLFVRVFIEIFQSDETILRFLYLVKEIPVLQN